MQPWAPRLRDDVGVSTMASNRLASTLAEDVRALSSETRTALAESSPVGFEQRLEELRAFQGFMDSVGAARRHPGRSTATLPVELPPPHWNQLDRPTGKPLFSRHVPSAASLSASMTISSRLDVGRCESARPERLDCHCVAL
jgi:hypothetical protein